MPKKILLRYSANYISLRLQKLLTGRVMLCEMKPVSCEEMYHTQAYCCYHLRWRLLTAESTPFPQRLTTPSENGEECGPRYLAGALAGREGSFQSPHWLLLSWIWGFNLPLYLKKEDVISWCLLCF